MTDFKTERVKSHLFQSHWTDVAWFHTLLDRNSPHPTNNEVHGISQPSIIITTLLQSFHGFHKLATDQTITPGPRITDLGHLTYVPPRQRGIHTGLKCLGHVYHSQDGGHILVDGSRVELRGCLNTPFGRLRFAALFNLADASVHDGVQRIHLINHSPLW